VPWQGKWFNDRDWKAFGRVGPDIGDKYQVRGTNYATGRLILHGKDNDKAPFILVVERFPIYQLVGWIYGAEGKKPEYWWATAPIPAFFVPREVMHSMETLPKYEPATNVGSAKPGLPSDSAGAA
jgi:hypothetical protein